MTDVESTPQQFHPDGTTRILWELVGKTLPFVVTCSLALERGIAIYRTPQGCVARPGDQVQVLCNQHIDTWGPIGRGVELILDLDPATAPPDSAPALELGYSAMQLVAYLEKARLDPHPPQGFTAS